MTTAEQGDPPDLVALDPLGRPVALDDRATAIKTATSNDPTLAIAASELGIAARGAGRERVRDLARLVDLGRPERLADARRQQQGQEDVLEPPARAQESAVREEQQERGVANAARTGDAMLDDPRRRNGPGQVCGGRSGSPPIAGRQQQHDPEAKPEREHASRIALGPAGRDDAPTVGNRMDDGHEHDVEDVEPERCPSDRIWNRSRIGDATAISHRIRTARAQARDLSTVLDCPARCGRVRGHALVGLAGRRDRPIDHRPTIARPGNLQIGGRQRGTTTSRSVKPLAEVALDRDRRP